MGAVAAHALRLYLPLLLLGATAGAIQVLGRRSATSARRRLWQAVWILLLLVGGPLYLFIAASFGWI
jgi:hypothetical protein